MPFEPAPPPAGAALAVRAWNLMGGLDWGGIETVAEMLGIKDIEALIADLATIRDHQARKGDRGG